MKYLVLIADLVASRDIAPREPLQDQLIALLAAKSSDGLSAREIVSPYTLTLGDEFQAVFSGGEHVLADMIDISRALHPTRVRYAYGIGEISTRINREAALRMDGPAFHLAREGLEELKRDAGTCSVNGLTQNDPVLVNATLRLMTNEMAKWRVNRLFILEALLEGRDVKDIANELGISEVAVYKNIDAGNLRTFVELTRALEGLLTRELQA